MMAAGERQILTGEGGGKILLYLLRCVDTVELGTAEQIGISNSFLEAAKEIGYLTGGIGGWALSDRGREWIHREGPFEHRHSLRSYTPLANRVYASAADGYGGR